MSKLKNNIENISGDTENLAKDYLKLLMIKQTEKLALFLGIFISIFVIFTLLLIVVLICSFAFAGFLNDVLNSGYWGFWIVGFVYIATIAILIFAMLRSKRPMLSNLFVKLISFVLEVDLKRPGTIQGLKLEKEDVNEKIDSGKEKIKSDFQLLRYSLLDGLLKEFLGLFARKKKTSPSEGD
ncbi:MAG: hypothetical protein ABFS28_14900 [Bacteroidota bacterium]